MNPQATREFALKALAGWAREVEEAERRTNIVERLGEPQYEPPPNGRDRIPCGVGSMSEASQSVDQCLHRIRAMDPDVFALLIGKAFGLSLQELATELEHGKTELRVRLEGAVGALRMALHVRSAG